MASDPCPDLLLLAVGYVAGEMSSAEMAAFETRLAHDQDACEAVAEAVELAGAFALLPTTTPLVLRMDRPRRLGVIGTGIGAAAAVLAMVVGLGVLTRRPPAPLASARPPGDTAASARPESVALAWSGLRQSGEVDLVSHSELLAWLDDSAASPSADLMAPGAGETEDEALSSWMLEAARLRGGVQPAGSGALEN